jgi:uncharacterized protein HemY
LGIEVKLQRLLEYLGYGYLRRGDYGNAYEAYEAAAVKYGQSGEAWVEERYGRDNTTRIKRKREEYDVVIGFRRPHLVSKSQCSVALFKCQ